MIELIGWWGSLLLAGCAIPQVYKSHKDGNSHGVSAGLLWMWWLGEILALIYVLGLHGFDGPLITNYIANIIFVTIILKYKYRPRQS